MRTIKIVDHTQKYRPPAGTINQIAAALTKQAQTFAADWNLDPQITVTADPKAAGIPINVEDNGNVPNALGWHQTDPHGAPEAFVLAGTVLSHGGTWISGANSVSAVASHELLELLGDLAANEFAYDGKSREWAIEMCDAVEMRSYSILGVAVSDYLLPSYFNPGAPGPYDKLSVLTRGFTIDRGGYSIVSKAGTETQIFGLLEPDEVFTVAPDPSGRYAVVVGPGFPAWRRELKEHGAARTMHRLALGHG